MVHAIIINVRLYRCWLYTIYRNILTAGCWKETQINHSRQLWHVFSCLHNKHRDRFQLREPRFHTFKENADNILDTDAITDILTNCLCHSVMHQCVRYMLCCLKILLSQSFAFCEILGSGTQGQNERAYIFITWTCVCELLDLIVVMWLTGRKQGGIR